MENKQINSVNEKPTRSQGANLKDLSPKVFLTFCGALMK